MGSSTWQGLRIGGVGVVLQLLMGIVMAGSNNFHHPASARKIEPPCWGMSPRSSSFSGAYLWMIRGGDNDVDVSSSSTADTHGGVVVDQPLLVTEEEPSLDDKVYAAMKKLGMSPPEETLEEDGNCQDGVCTIPSTTTTTTTATTQCTGHDNRRRHEGGLPTGHGSNWCDIHLWRSKSACLQ
jgi:hypothetical protein